MVVWVDGFGVTWTVGPQDAVAVEETGPHPASPPMLVVTGETVVSLVVPKDLGQWPACVVFLRQLRDGVDDLAALLTARAAAPVGLDGDGGHGQGA